MVSLTLLLGGVSLWGCNVFADVAGQRIAQIPSRIKASDTAQANDTLTRPPVNSTSVVQAGRPAHGANTAAYAYSLKSPHWSHIRVHVSDYRIQYEADPAVRAAEYAWSAK